MILINFKIKKCMYIWCGNFVKRHSFPIVLGDSPESMRKLYLSINFPHQEVRWSIFTVFFTVKVLQKWQNWKIWRLVSQMALNARSWRKGWRQIHETKQKSFFFGTFYSWFLRFFTEKRQNLALGGTAGYSPSKPSILGIFLKFPNFLRY